jgi:hypothetical protein
MPGQLEIVEYKIMQRKKDIYEETNHIFQPNTELCHLIHTSTRQCLGQPDTTRLLFLNQKR